MNLLQKAICHEVKSLSILIETLLKFGTVGVILLVIVSSNNGERKAITVT